MTAPAPTVQQPSCSRRAFLFAGLAIGIAVRADDSPPAGPPAPPLRARRPQPPFRIWFQPRLWHRDTSLYAHMTVDASGWLDPHLAELAGVTALDWAYGLNHPDAGGPDYWRNACADAGRAHPRKVEPPKFISAGIALDEWVPPAQPDNEKWLAEGLRAGRKENPDVFIAIWSTEPTPALFELARDGTADLLIIEGYTHSVKPGHSTSWDGALRRCEKFAEAKVLEKTIFSFGHITAQKNHRGEHLKQKRLREQAEELKRRFPAMPGIAFFQPDCPDTPEQRELIRFCDRLSAELWPDAKQD
ncbi:MAG: hypothetical protein WCS99_15700 [Limisphaerales bacterium]